MKDATALLYSLTTEVVEHRSPDMNKWVNETLEKQEK